MVRCRVVRSRGEGAGREKSRSRPGRERERVRGAKDTHTVPRISVCGGTTGGREEEEEDDDDERTERNGRTGEELGDKRERETEENEETCGGWRELLGRSKWETVEGE